MLLYVYVCNCICIFKITIISYSYTIFMICYIMDIKWWNMMEQYHIVLKKMTTRYHNGGFSLPWPVKWGIRKTVPAPGSFRSIWGNSSMEKLENWALALERLWAPWSLEGLAPSSDRAKAAPPRWAGKVNGSSASFDMVKFFFRLKAVSKKMAAQCWSNDPNGPTSHEIILILFHLRQMPLKNISWWLVGINSKIPVLAPEIPILQPWSPYLPLHLWQV